MELRFTDVAIGVSSLNPLFEYSCTRSARLGSVSLEAIGAEEQTFELWNLKGTGCVTLDSRFLGGFG